MSDPSTIAESAAGEPFLVGEFRRTVDERFRLTLPTEFASAVTDPDQQCVLVKERAGCVSLWHPEAWRSTYQQGVSLIRQKIQAGRLAQRWDEVQRLGRLLSTRDESVRLAGRNRLLIPDSFRDFLEAAPGEEVVIIGAVVCVELWTVRAWLELLRSDMPGFTPMFKALSE